jgi:hypothetical protein
MPETFDWGPALAAGKRGTSVQVTPLVRVIATVTRDYFNPSPTDKSDCYSDEYLLAWARGDWTFWDMDLAVWVGDHCVKDCAASLGLIDCVDRGFQDVDHLNDVANDLLRQVDVPEIVRAFAATAALAAEEVSHVPSV